MTIPRENMLAFDPPCHEAGNVTLGPLTVGGAVRLAARGIGLGEKVSRDKLFAAAYVMADPSCSFASWLKHVKVGLNELSNAVEDVLNDAFEPFIKPFQEQGGTIHLSPHGLGWPLELADFLCSEYGWTFYEAAETPVARAYALLAAARQRHGGKHGGFDYIEKDYINSMKRQETTAEGANNG